MKQTKEILNRLENQYSNIDYYYTIVEKIEENVNSNPDITIECCKALLEGLSKFIWQQLDTSYDSDKINKNLNLQELYKSALKQLSKKCKLFEEDFVNRTGAIIHLLGHIRTHRGDISHGKLSPKEEFSDQAFAKLVYTVTDGIVSYLLTCFSTIPMTKDLEFEDNPEFNEKLDNENAFGFLSYSKALFDQDIEAYKQELLNHLDLVEISIENE